MIIEITDHCLKRFCERGFKTKDKNLIKAIIKDSKEVELPVSQGFNKVMRYNSEDLYFYNPEYKLLFTLVKKCNCLLAVTVSRNDKNYHY
jgi:hypothetical protein